MKNDSPAEKIGSSLKRIRSMRKLSLDEVSDLTGVSKPMLGQIERGVSVPTVTTLWKIASGLKTPFSSFLAEPQNTYNLADKESGSAVEEENGSMRAYALFPYDPVRSAEVFFIEFDPGCRHESERHNEGVEEYILIVSGKLTMELNGETINVSEGQSLRFRADIPHCYLNCTREICSIYNILFYSE